MNTITAIWQHANRWWIGHTPDKVLLVPSLAEADIAALQNDIARFAAAHPAIQAFGALSYELGLPLGSALPGAGFIYLFCEPQGFDSLPELAASLPAAPALLPAAQPRLQTSQSHYQRSFTRIHEHLKNGDVYQINYSECFAGPALDAPLQRWLQALQQRPAPHACYIELPELPNCPIKTLMSFSPERLLRISNRQALTEPIKGSAARGVSAQQDTALGQALQASDKNRAENLMIVDLLRNDLGKICQTGSVKTEQLFELRKFPTIQHLVSTISGALRPDISPLAALASVFPGGSITGAPKIKAMEIIQSLEAQPRNFYCGSAFSLDAQGNLDANILIRTFQQTENQLYCHAGGGIVMDSVMDEEFEEMHFKIEPLIAALCAAHSPPVPPEPVEGSST